MAPPSKWDDEDDSTPPSSPPQVARRGKFDDEEDEDDVVDDWDAAEDSEAEREKAKKAAPAPKKAAADALANKKSKTERMKEHIEERRRKNEEDKEDKEDKDDETSEEEEDANIRRMRLRQTEQDADLKHAEDLFGNVGLGAKTRSAPRSIVAIKKNGEDTLDPTASVDLGTLPVFNPKTKADFQALNDTLSPLISALHKNGHYSLFVQEFAKNIVKDLPSTEVKKVSTALSTLSNEKLKEEKNAEKGGKKTKAAKTKTSLVASRDVSYKADVSTYDDELGDDDFM